MNKDGSDLKIHPVGLSVEDVKWAKSRFWAPDAAIKWDLLCIFLQKIKTKFSELELQHQKILLVHLKPDQNL